MQRKRFIQRYDSFSRALARLQELVEIIRGEETQSVFSNEKLSLEDDIILEALIKRFEFTQELSWNLLKDYMTYQGEVDLTGSRDVYRRALKLGLIHDPLWLNMILDRNLSAHDYNDLRAKEIGDRIVNLYYPLLTQLSEEMKRKKIEEEN